MTIKQLVISGGGAIGFQYVGALHYLHNNGFWKTEDIQNIYATSVGTIIAVLICLRYDWDIINEYFIGRPWHDLFKLTGKQIIEAYYNKGLYDKKIFELCFKPLLEAKDLSLNITLKELYEYSHIYLHFYTFELNSFKTIEINHEVNPNLLLIEAINMSCAIPGLFMPIFLEDDKYCYIDGGVMMNYPLSFCLEQHSNKEEILAFNYSINKNNNQINMDNSITKDSSILDFILGFSTKAMNFIIQSILSNDKIPFEIVWDLESSPVSLSYIKGTIQSKECREQFLQEGYKRGKEFFESLNTIK
jgi:predicted acylesterase/phospholipase RssA